MLLRIHYGSIMTQLSHHFEDKDGEVQEIKEEAEGKEVREDIGERGH